MYKIAINLNPSNPVAYHNLANTYKATGEVDLAIENYKKAIELNPKFFFAYNALVDIYLENENYKEARKVLENYLNYAASKTDALFLLAQIAAQEKDFKAGLSYLEEALALDPENQFIQDYIIRLKSLIGSKNNRALH